MKLFRMILACLKSMFAVGDGDEAKPVSDIITSYKNEVEVDKDLNKRQKAFNQLMKLDKIEVKEYKRPVQHLNVMKY